MEGFFALPVWGASFLEGLIHEGAYFRNFTIAYNKYLSKPSFFSDKLSVLSNMIQKMN